jgi:hypothetical protein
MNIKINILNLTLALLILFSGFLKAQIENKNTEQVSLFDTIVKLDSQLFEQGFNQCQFEIWTALINQDLEFYDDRSGLNESKDIEIASFKDRCGIDNKSRIKRELISTEVFPLNGFGAVQLGTHGFYLPNSSKHDFVEVAKFIHIWALNNGNWTVKRVVSYDHKSTNK